MLTIITLILCAILFVRLFTYRRQGAQYRPAVSWLATIVMASAGAAVIFILDGQLRVQLLAWPLVILLGVFTAAAVRCEGNLSAVMKGPAAWNGRERRK